MVDALAAPPLLDPRAPLGTPFRAAIDRRISDFLRRQGAELIDFRPDIALLLDLTTTLLAGGKRLRPAFCAWGYVAARGVPSAQDDLDAVLTAAASLELLHASALVHDDVMDGSDTRRGAPSAHRQFEQHHTEHELLGDPEAFGRAAAIVLGDLLVMWSVELLEQAGLPEDTRADAFRIAQLMRTEVTCGQYLDVAAQAWPLGADLDRALTDANRVVEYKSARYTVYRPAQLGSAVGAGSPGLRRTLADYGSPLGRAFQFRDDVLGVFGVPTVTGKPVGDDLREGKRTVLVAYALAHTDAAGRALLASRLGDPDLDEDGVAALQQLISESGALDAVESMISRNLDEAVAALDDPAISAAGREGLTVLARAAVHRSA